MSEQDSQEEPTMEEILASIRRIISDDDENASADVSAEDGEEGKAAPETEAVAEIVPDPEPESAPEPKSEPEPEPEIEAAAEAEDDVLELTEEMEEVEEVVSDDDIESIMATEGDGDETEAPEEDSAEAEPDAPPMEPDVLVADVTEQSSQEALDRLSAIMVAGYDGADNTLEGLVRELLKPMLQAYLDDSLPEIVRDVVEREVARIARKK